MKQWMLFGILAVGAVCSTLAQPVVYSFNFNNGFNNGGAVPDGNLAGWSDTRNISGVLGNDNDNPNAIFDINVFLNLSGGYNGDLYGYLVHSSGFAVLLNRPGRSNLSPFGYSDAGMNLAFDEGAANNVHTYQLVPGYAVSLNDGSTWQPDGRNTNPTSVNGSETRDSLLDSFNGLSADGNWTLFLADLSVGETSTVVNWGMQVTATPEPSTFGLLGLGAALAGVQWWRVQRRRG
jgi:subtilisin-like proprotein convertase family protein